MNQLYKVDKKKKKYILKEDFKKTQKWKNSKGDRTKGYLLMLLPIIIFAPIYLYLVTNKVFANNVINIIGNVLFGVIGVCALAGAILIRQTYLNAKMIDNRIEDEIWLTTGYLEYSYTNPEDKRRIKFTIPYDSIKNIIHYKYYNQLIVECCYVLRKEDRTSNSSKLSKITSFERIDNLETLEIPMYFEKETELVYSLALASEHKIVVIEEKEK